MGQGWTIKNVGLSYDYGQEIVRAYNKEGCRGVRHRRKEITPPGRAALLNQAQQEKLKGCLEEAAEDGGIWTGPKVAQWIVKETGIEKVWNQRGWDSAESDQGQAMSKQTKKPKPALKVTSSKK